MARIESYKDLTVWQRAMTLAAECYRLTAAFPPEERYGLTAQIRRCAVSIPSNLAEGHNRRSRQAFANHVGIALGSQAELETQITPAVRLEFTSNAAATQDVIDLGGIITARSVEMYVLLWHSLRTVVPSQRFNIKAVTS